MATETFARRGRARWYPRWAGRALAGVAALVALALVAVEVVWPLSAGLPIGWGQYQNSAYHLHIGTPAFWNVTADSSGFHNAVADCGFIVVASPNTEPALHSTVEAMVTPRWMSVAAMNPPCGGMNGGGDSLAAQWQPTGQRIEIAGQSAPIESEVVGPPALTYRASVTLHGSIYIFTLHDSSAAQAQRDLPDFLTFARSFRYVS